MSNKTIVNKESYKELKDLTLQINSSKIKEYISYYEEYYSLNYITNSNLEDMIYANTVSIICRMELLKRKHC